MTDVRGKGLARLYRTGGVPLLAHRLGWLITEIKTEEDRVMHNAVLSEAMDLLNTTVPRDTVTDEERSFLGAMADYLLFRRVSSKDEEQLKIERHKRFLFRMADRIMQIADMKGH